MVNEITIGVGIYKSRVNGVKTKEYNTWRDMIKRVYSESYHTRFPQYKTSTLFGEWHDFQKFASWYVSQKFCSYGYELDKDILVEGNKLYSPETCCLIPKQLNYLLNSNKANRGIYKQGVIRNKKSGRFHSQLKVRGVSKYLGSYESESKAYSKYKKEKESYVKEVTLEWKDKIDDRVFLRLINWELTD